MGNGVIMMMGYNIIRQYPDDVTGVMDYLIEEAQELSKKLMELSSFSLTSIGVRGKAYLRNDAILIVSLARHNIVPVLGGDVYCKSEFDNDIHITYDNWYCNREEFESLKDYVERSCDVAEQYILNYTAQKGFEPILSL